MPKKKVIKASVEAKITPKIPEVKVSAEEVLRGRIEGAKQRLNHFLELRKNAVDMQIYENASFWIAHFKQKISDLENSRN